MPTLFRGQGFDRDNEPGCWWSDSVTDAENFGNVYHSHMILSVDVDSAFLKTCEGMGRDATIGGNWYKIPKGKLKTQALAVRIIGGRIRL